MEEHEQTLEIATQTNSRQSHIKVNKTRQYLTPYFTLRASLNIAAKGTVIKTSEGNNLFTPGFDR